MHQIRLLSRAFFSGLFESDLMPDGLPQVQLVIWGMLLAATPTTAYAILMPIKYAKAQFSVPLAPEFDADRLILITLSMIAIGVVGLVIWDGVFPDRRDVRILGVLPIPTRRFVIARLASLGRVFVLFATPLCTLQSIVFGMTVTGFGAPISRIHGISAHFLTVALACTFVFCALVAAQCLLLLVFGRRAAQAASVTFQVLFAVGLVQLLFFLPDLGECCSRGQPRGSAGCRRCRRPGSSASTRRWRARRRPPCSLRAAAGHRRDDPPVLLARRPLRVQLHRRCRSARSKARRAHAAGSWASRAARSGPRATASTRRCAVRSAGSRCDTLVRSRTHRMMLAVYGGLRARPIVCRRRISVALRNDGAGVLAAGARR